MRNSSTIAPYAGVLGNSYQDELSDAYIDSNHNPDVVCYKSVTCVSIT